MELPKPVNLAMLSGLLNKSKQVMNKSEQISPTANNSRGNMNESYSQPSVDDYEDRVPDSMYGTQNLVNLPDSQIQGQTQELGDYSDEQVMNSKLPQAIKESMLAKRIPRLSTPPSGIDMSKMANLGGRLMPKSNQPLPNNRTVINEQIQPRVGSDMITISKDELKDMITESISTFFKESYNKTLTEETIKKTINLLIKEGKITTKKK